MMALCYAGYNVGGQIFPTGSPGLLWRVRDGGSMHLRGGVLLEILVLICTTRLTSHANQSHLLMKQAGRQAGRLAGWLAGWLEGGRAGWMWLVDAVS